MKAAEQKVSKPKLSMAQAKECGHLLMTHFKEILSENCEYRDGRLRVASGGGKMIPVTRDGVKQEIPLDEYLRTIGSLGTQLYTVTASLRHLAPVAYHEQGMKEFNPPLWFEVEKRENGEPYVTDWGFEEPESEADAKRHRSYAEKLYLPTNSRAPRKERVYEWRQSTSSFLS